MKLFYFAINILFYIASITFYNPFLYTGAFLYKVFLLQCRSSELRWTFCALKKERVKERWNLALQGFDAEIKRMAIDWNKSMLNTKAMFKRLEQEPEELICSCGKCQRS